MLAISRALLLNPTLLVMDEPTEGLAPLIVEQVEQILVHLGDEGDIAVLLIEQNIGVATAVAEQRRDHGQRPHQPHHGRAPDRRRPRPAAAPARRRPPRRRRCARRGRRAGSRPRRRSAAPRRARARIYISNPRLPTRWTPPVPVAQIERAARTRLGPAGGGPERRARRPRSGRSRPLGEQRRVVAGTLDTKGDGAPLHPRPDQGRRPAHPAGRPLDHRQGRARPTSRRIRSRSTTRKAPSAVFTNDRGRSVAGMARRPSRPGFERQSRDRRDHRGRRLGRHGDGRPGDAPACRSACPSS